MMSGMRVGIVGCAGTGKSTLAEAISNRMSIPFLKSKDITEEILKRDGYDFSAQIQVERFLANSGRQNEILRKTIEQQSVESFVSDRTLVDLAAYAICEMHGSDIRSLRNIVETCRKNVPIYTHLLLCPWREKQIENTSKRTLNPFYQLLIHTVELGVLCEWGCQYFVLKTEGDDRISEILRIFDGCGVQASSIPA